MTTTELIIYCDEVISEQKDIIEDFGDYDDGLKDHCEKTIENFKQIQERLRTLILTKDELYKLYEYKNIRENILDKVIEEIEEEFSEVTDDISHGRNRGLYKAVEIIEKYKKEIEE